MSRFVEEAAELPVITPATVLELTEHLSERLQASASNVLLRFPLFTERPAPVTGVSAPHRYDVWLGGEIDRGDPESARVRIGVRAAVTSLCPCSREISDYGAHSQRGHVELEVEAPGWRSGESIWPHELFCYADGAGSAQIHPLLKRPDERAVTMGAYDRPAFVEDIARDVVLAVKADERCAAWSVTVVNQESIHDHQAIARVRGRR
jgi:GTP cyclohydrolase FolE2